MGTRNLIAVKLDGDLRIAQYCQWDGYPSGQGRDVLAFARSLTDPSVRAEFLERVRMTRWSTDADWAEAEKAVGIEGKEWITMEEGDRLTKLYPGYSRDTGADILEFVLNGTVTVLQDMRTFVLDPTFCEWAYLLDLDGDVLEVYSGTGGTAGFFDTVGAGAVKRIASFPLADLPAQEEFEVELGEELS